MHIALGLCFVGWVRRAVPIHADYCCSRHGESVFNVQGLIGGNPPLSPLGEQYAELLSEFAEQSEELSSDEVMADSCR